MSLLLTWLVYTALSFLSSNKTTVCTKDSLLSACPPSVEVCVIMELPDNWSRPTSTHQFLLRWQGCQMVFKKTFFRNIVVFKPSGVGQL